MGLGDQPPAFVSRQRTGGPSGNNSGLPSQRDLLTYQQIHSASCSRAGACGDHDDAVSGCRGISSTMQPDAGCGAVLRHEPQGRCQRGIVFANKVSPQTEVNVFLRKLITCPRCPPATG